MTYTVNQEDPTNVVFAEKWESRDKYETYFAWRQQTGVLDRLVPMLRAEPSVRFLDPVKM
jgi:quinol monooxygenase YgiN